MKCGNVLIDPLKDIFALHCALQKIGVINKENRIVKNNGVEYCTAVVSEKNVDLCKKEVTDCIDKESKKLGSNIDELHRQINCIIKKGMKNNIDCSMHNVKKNA
ncbi:PREDICTED: venom allergen 2-like [Acromyrmex echinatior]|uniref:venom allergen 2-like n=1 Tax=Acromyrmex echinatior TaxID=103372 RepID=UPI0005810657|nr:PREDICTED: venom allergen 2-like [Acromyrmex echinatior]